MEMMKESTWINGNHMRFDSLHKMFNRQVDSISTGNVWGHCQFSGFIRAYNETECNGFTNPVGHLQQWDINQFTKGVPDYVWDKVKECAINNGVILYQFRYFEYGYEGRKIVMGHVITTADYDNPQLIRSYYAKNTLKCMSVIDEAIKYITGKRKR